MDLHCSVCHIQVKIMSKLRCVVTQTVLVKLFRNHSSVYDASRYVCLYFCGVCVWVWEGRAKISTAHVVHRQAALGVAIVSRLCVFMLWLDRYEYYLAQGNDQHSSWELY